MEDWYVSSTLLPGNFKLVQVIEESFAFALSTKDKDIVIDDAACMTVSRLWNRPELLTLDPS